MHAKRIFLGAVLLVSAAQQTRADCLADFKATNAHRKDFSRYEMMVSAEVLNPDGAVVRHMQSSSQFDLSEGLRMKTSGLNTQSDIILIGETGWMRESGRWAPMPAYQLRQSLAGVVADRYVYDTDTRDFECPGSEDFEGKPHDRFVFNQTVGALESRVTAYFDPVSHLPVATVAEAEVNDYKVVATTRYRFDPAIRIERPE